ncbi:MAG: chloride channel protein [Desulfuromonadaceae bacterium]|nr:chloride channel protein [Desulfuromonadaceae bacterium]MDD2856640.1 chloride channel protein [Desulfuromonadaceae bacterium]
MKKHITEQVTLFASVVKWTLYASIVGALVGVGTSGFLSILALTSKKVEGYPYYYIFLPLTLLVSAGLVRWLAPDAAGHGTEKVIEAVHKRMGKIPFAVVPVKLVATVITLASGGSAGKEGPCAQIGGGLASAFADLIRVSGEDRRKLVICGIGAGFATVFGTPIAGALFGVEVLVLGQMMYEVLFPSFVAGIVGYHVAIALGVSYPHQSASMLPKLSGWSFFEVIALGVCCGLAALLFIEVMKLVHSMFGRLEWHWTLKAVLGGVLLASIGGLISQSYLGLGLETMDSALNGAVIPAGAVFWKIITTSITLSCGGSGGVLTPIFFIGSSLGNLFAQMFNPQYIAAFSAIGMVALLAGAANTPIAASVMAMEIFGPQIAPFAAIACMVSFLIAGYRSIYPSQILGIQKSGQFQVPTGGAIGDMGEVTVYPRKQPFTGFMIKVRRRYRKRK